MRTLSPLDCPEADAVSMKRSTAQRTCKPIAMVRTSPARPNTYGHLPTPLRLTVSASNARPNIPSGGRTALINEFLKSETFEFHAFAPKLATCFQQNDVRYFADPVKEKNLATDALEFAFQPHSRPSCKMRSRLILQVTFSAF